MDNANAIAKILLKLGAVSLSPKAPFTWASGLKSPLYCDNRLIISTVTERRTVIQSFVDTIKAQQWQADVIAGTATAGIPHGAWVAEALGLPMVYVRSSSKKHGKQNLIEGRIEKGQKVVVVEDLISTGGSCIRAAQALTEAGAEVIGVVAIFQYGLEKANTAFREADLAYTTLSNLSALLDQAVAENYINEEESQWVAEWRQDPQAWSDARSS